MPTWLVKTQGTVWFHQSSHYSHVQCIIDTGNLQLVTSQPSFVHCWRTPISMLATSVYTDQFPTCVSSSRFLRVLLTPGLLNMLTYTICFLRSSQHRKHHSTETSLVSARRYCHSSRPWTRRSSCRARPIICIWCCRPPDRFRHPSTTPRRRLVSALFDDRSCCVRLASDVSERTAGVPQRARRWDRRSLSPTPRSLTKS